MLLDVKLGAAFKSLTPTLGVEGHLLTVIIELNGIKVLSLKRMWPADSTNEWEAETRALWLWDLNMLL